ncbi:MAG: carboxypeptidase-like regulatory domain-containing protein [Pyrinomonadaceae bacterium]
MRRVIQVLTVALLLAHAGLAQRQQPFPANRPKTILLGTVYDIHHSVILRAQIVARDTEGHDYEATTNGEGVYSFDVPVGIYEVEANADGFCPRRVSDFKATDGVLDFVLMVRGEIKPCKQRSMLKPLPTERQAIRRPNPLRGIAE